VVTTSTVRRRDRIGNRRAYGQPGPKGFCRRRSKQPAVSEMGATIKLTKNAYLQEMTYRQSAGPEPRRVLPRRRQGPTPDPAPPHDRLKAWCVALCAHSRFWLAPRRCGRKRNPRSSPRACSTPGRLPPCVALPLVSTVGFWLATRWIPGMPSRRAGIPSMIRFGGVVTLISAIVYVAYNLDKVLLGRFWGAVALGIYGRSFQIINIPTDNLNSAVGEVAFAALSRLQGDLIRLRSYFLKGYSLVLAMTVPMTCTIAIFPHDLVMVVLGAKWVAAAEILRLLAPTVLVFAVLNPLGWLLLATGKIRESLKRALVLAPVVIIGYSLGLRYGPTGVAMGFSTAMMLWVLPHIAWCVRGTPISFGDVMKVLAKPLFSGVIAVAVAKGFQFLCPQWLPFPRLVFGVALLLSVYTGMLLYVMGQKGFYVGLFRQLGRRSSLETESLAAANEA